MKRARSALLALGAVIVLPLSASAQDKGYFGLSMFSPNYKTNGGNHRSTGLMGRLGYDLNKRFAVEAHFGGSIGSESIVNSNVGQAQMTSVYGGFARANTQFGFSQLYVLGGFVYGTREITQPNSSVSLRDNDSNKAFGFGVTVSDKGTFGVGLEWIRYFDNRYYAVNAWNLGIVNRF